MNKVKRWFLDRFQEISIGDPNSPDGFRQRAWILIRGGTAPDNPYVSVLVKQALLRENRESEIPDPDAWELMSASEKEEWVLKNIGKEKP